jgi:hypothetical protein
MVRVAIVCVCWNAAWAAARTVQISPLLDNLAMSTGTYISQARACKTHEWKRALRESAIEVRRRNPESDLKYFQLVIAWADRYEAPVCDQTAPLTIRQAQQISFDRFIEEDRASGCKLSPDLVC